MNYGRFPSTRLTTRDDFNPVLVMSQIEDYTKSELRRILAEACHVIVRQENQIAEIKGRIDDLTRD